MKKFILVSLVSLTLGNVFVSCKKEGCTDEAATNYDEKAKKDDGSYIETGPNDLSTIVDKFYTGATVSVGTNEITISTTDQPDHTSMYYPTNHTLYASYTEPQEPKFFQNPNTIAAQNYVFKIPRYPAEASSKTATSFDAIGVAINGVVFYNQVAAPGDDILDELYSFDQEEGHPTNTGSYHHHTEPVYLTSTKGNDAFIGLMMDGFPIYGPYENDVKLTNSDLDDYHGHSGATAEFPNGIYHYHVTDDLPWINGGEYFGTPGSFTN